MVTVATNDIHTSNLPDPLIPYKRVSRKLKDDNRNRVMCERATQIIVSKLIHTVWTQNAINNVIIN